MKGLDTPILLELLRGRKPASRLLESLRGEELATTELNMFELESLARAGPHKGMDRRLATLDSLRHKITVLSVDEKGCRTAASRVFAKAGVGAGAVQALMLGAAEASGCTEWLTTRAARPAAPSGRLKIRILAY